MSSRDLRHFVYCYLFTESIYKGAMPVGSMLSGIMMELCGRRRAVQIAVSSVSIGCLLIVLSTLYPLLLVGRTVCRFGISASIPGLYVSKINRNTRNLVKM